ncbi:tRNA lysidine(34) synthetase TilS [Kocuria marina]|uniref:tRNA lysidine(34) synthetase TilS n=1 Tax=Kocuria marina TaxID=223184 RepID=UPI0022E9560A|nr:tRNA lysidine(34) synthetase TilS [Kocuria marina]
MQHGRAGRLHPVVARARRAVARTVDHLPRETSAGGADARDPMRPDPSTTPRETTTEHAGAGTDPRPPLVLVACSGGADSLALAAAAAHLARRGRVRVGAVVVDHGLQEGSAEAARDAARTVRELGLEPVAVERVTVVRQHHGPEMAARLARYGALNDVAHRTGAAAVLLGHTRDDQAETVLLGLARGSGTRSLSGMPERHHVDDVLYLRPFLNVTRAETETVCAAEGLSPWHDPTNADTALTRARVRHEVLPYLESQLGPGVSRALARTASVLGADADYLDEQASLAFDAALVPAASSGSSVVLDGATVQGTPAALRRRMLAKACVLAGGETPTFERLSALEQFALGYGAAGPVQMAGKVAAWRHRSDATHARGCLELRGERGPRPQETSPPTNDPGSAQ